MSDVEVYKNTSSFLPSLTDYLTVHTFQVSAVTREEYKLLQHECKTLGIYIILACLTSLLILAVTTLKPVSLLTVRGGRNSLVVLL